MTAPACMPELVCAYVRQQTREGGKCSAQICICWESAPALPAVHMRRNRHSGLHQYVMLKMNEPQRVLGTCDFRVVRQGMRMYGSVLELRHCEVLIRLFMHLISPDEVIKMVSMIYMRNYVHVQRSVTSV